MVVVDANIIAYYSMPTTFTSEVRVLFDVDSQWHVPLLWRSELRSVLTKYVKIAELTIEQATTLYDAAKKLVVGREHDVSARAVLTVAASSKCSSYDAEYVVLAQNLGTSLITYDKKILSAFPDTAFSPKNFLNRS